MMGVMIMGRGVAKTGAMDRFSRMILEKAGNGRTRILGILAVAVGAISGLVQNIGAVALFLPGILDISRRAKIPASSLIMPVGYAAILGGTLTMVGSGPLILTNDLLRSAGLEPYGLFSVTPVGVLLLASGIGYLLLFGRRVLPRAPGRENLKSEQEKMVEAFHLPHKMRQCAVEAGSPLRGRRRKS